MPRYGVVHKAKRRYLAPRVEAGLVDCWRCGKPIRPGEPWDLGHVDDDPLRWAGPEHRRCNRATASSGKRRVSRQWSPDPPTG